MNECLKDIVFSLTISFDIFWDNLKANDSRDNQKVDIESCNSTPKVHTTLQKVCYEH